MKCGMLFVVLTVMTVLGGCGKPDVNPPGKDSPVFEGNETPEDGTVAQLKATVTVSKMADTQIGVTLEIAGNEEVRCINGRKYLIIARTGVTPLHSSVSTVAQC